LVKPQEIAAGDESEEIDEDADDEETAAAEQEEREEEAAAFAQQMAQLEEIIDGTAPHWAGIFGPPPPASRRNSCDLGPIPGHDEGRDPQAQNDARKTKAMLIAEWKKRRKN